MTANEIREFLLWCAGINYGILLLWFLAFVRAREWMYGMHSRWFKLPADTFDVIHYSAMAAYKIGILLFNLVPLAAVCLMM